MQISLRIAIVAVLSAIVGATCSLYAAGSDNVKPLELVAGDFLSRRYLQTLADTRSPFAAEGGQAINLIEVQKKDGVTTLFPVLNFHEGGPVIRFDKSGQGVLEDPAGLDAGRYFVRLLSKQELRAGFADSPVENFIAVKDLQLIVRGKSVAGRYLDDKNQAYSFGSDGVATTPDSTFQFTVGIDHVPYLFDYIENSDTHQILKFVRKECRTDIFEVTDAVENQHGNDGSHAKPWASLRQIGCKAGR